jgi:quinol monooxygenase YgiN
MRIITVIFEIQRGRQAEFRSVMEVHAKKSLELEPGCRQFDLGADPANPSRFMVYEVYDDEAAVAAHQAMPHFAETRARLGELVEARTRYDFELIAGGKPQR